MSANFHGHTPTLDELPVDIFDVSPETIADDERTFTEIHAADNLTVAARKKGSAFAAAFNAVMRRAGVIEACHALNKLERLKVADDPEYKPTRFDPNEIKCLYLTMVDAAQRTEWLAEKTKSPCPKRRRFKCSAASMEIFHKREAVSFGMDEAQRKRHFDTLARTWRKRWAKVHAVQRHLHLGFFIHEKGEASGEKKKAGHFTDHLTDLIADTARRAAKSDREPVNRYNVAADSALAHFRATIKPYAPEWTPGDTDPKPSCTKPKPDKDLDPWKTVKASCKRLIRDALLTVREQGLSEDEALAKRAELQAFIETEWTSAQPSPPTKSQAARSAPSLPPPVVVNTDTAKNETISDSPEDDLDRANLPYLNAEKTANSLGKTQTSDGKNAVFSAAPEDQATATVEAFQSVGTTRFKVVVLDAKPLNGQARCVASEDVDVAALLTNVAGYIKRSETQSESVCLRSKDGALIQVDDCPPETHALLQPFSFLTVETSPGSFQAWLALSPETDEEERKSVRDRLLRTLKATGANGGAFNSVRLPGALNAKEKYKATLGEYPRVRLVSVAYGRIVTPLELERAGLLAPAEEKPTVKAAPSPRYTSSSLPDHFPDFNEYLSRKWLSNENRPDRSSAEMAWCCAALGKGFPPHMVEDELRRVSLKAKGRRDGYIEKTVDSAASWLASQPQPAAHGGRERMVV
jgi:hypothetical protein